MRSVLAPAPHPDAHIASLLNKFFRNENFLYFLKVNRAALTEGDNRHKKS